MAMRLYRAKVMLLVTFLIDSSCLSAWGDYREQAVCGDTVTSSRDLEREFKGEHEANPTTFSIAGLTLNENRLADVEGRFGLSTPASTFSDHGAVSECYKSTKWPSDPTVVTFTAGSAGGFTDLTGFELKYDSTAEAEKCVTSSLVGADLGTASGLRLGLAQTEMQKILGRGKPSADEIRRWFYEGEVPVSAAEAKRSGHSFYDEFSGVIARFRDSKADCISVFQTQTY